MFGKGVNNAIEIEIEIEIEYTQSQTQAQMEIERESAMRPSIKKNRRELPPRCTLLSNSLAAFIIL